MTSSMTAFARTQSDDENGSYAWEVRSVNHRYLEAQFKLPERFRALEPQLRERLRARLGRGKIDIHLYFKAGSADTNMVVNGDKVASLLDVAQQVGRAAGLEGELTIHQLLQWPGVLEQAEIDLEAIATPLLAAFESTVDDLVIARQAEGEKLARLIVDRLEQIEQMVAAISQRMPAIVTEHRQRIEARLEELQVEIDKDRLAQEIVLLAQKVDVAEELDRLSAHVAEVRSTLQKGEPCGRRLDFLMQELNREANTLGSKSITVDSSQGAVDLKVLIEQMREQVQNIE